jgi:NADH-quinone oxidoreductase subunit N
MNYTAPQIEWLPLAPILIVLGAAALGILVEAFIRTPHVRRVVQVAVTLLALASAGVVGSVHWATLDGSGTIVMSDMVTVDRQSLAWQLMIVVFAAFAALLYADRTKAGDSVFTPLGAAAPGSTEETLARRKGLELTEVFPLLLFATGGMMLFTAVTDYLFLFVALELLSLPLYIMVSLARRRRLLSHEAALKYFLLGAFSSALYLFGAALIYGATTQTSFVGLSKLIPVVGSSDPILLVGVVLVLVGLFFKLGAAPFHSWVPDVYQGSPTPVVAFMAAATKAAAAAALLRIIFSSLYTFSWELNVLFWTVAIVSMVVGTVVALVQTDIKRMLAYSAIAHAGFILVALVGFLPGALAAVPFYVLTYGLASVGAFAVMTQVRERESDGTVTAEAPRLGQWTGLGARSPFLAGSMALFLLSLAGIPLTAGFVGKFTAFGVALSAGAWPLVLVAVLASAVAAFFYVRLIVLMFFTDAPEVVKEAVAVEVTPLARIVIVLTGALVLALGVFPAWALQFAEDAAVLVTGVAGS